jgi:hypothetical protein
MGAGRFVILTKTLFSKLPQIAEKVAKNEKTALR